jgi:hypothetical protein
MQHAVNEQTVQIFVKSRRYLLAAELSDLHFILQHSTFATIKGSVNSASSHLLIECLSRFPDDPFISSVFSTLVKQISASAKDAKIQLRLLQTGQLTPTREQLEGYLEFFVKSCAVQPSRDPNREAEAIENFEASLEQLGFLLTAPKFSARLDPYDDVFYRQALKFCDGRSHERIRTAVRYFFSALCITYGSEMRDSVTTLITDQLSLGRKLLSDKVDLVHLLLTLAIDFGDCPAEALAKHASVLRQKFREFNAIVAVADLIPAGDIPEWVPGFWVAWSEKHKFGENRHDVEFSELALTRASFEQAADFLERRFSGEVPSRPYEWKIAAAIFLRFPDHHAELVTRFAFHGRPFRVTPDIAPFVDDIFGPGPISHEL